MVKKKVVFTKDSILIVCNISGNDIIEFSVKRKRYERTTRFYKRADAEYLEYLKSLVDIVKS